MDSPAAHAAADVLSSKGEKLHTHEMHIRRSDNKKYIVKHDLATKEGNPPSDGQKATQEHSLNNMAELQAHLAQAMPEEQDTEQNPAATS
jgi:hypothetical protein